MPHVFISYSRHNQKYARALADYLIAAGFDVWIDDRIDYGSRWAEVIQKAIENCAAFVVVMTPQSRDSHWVQTECEYAAQRRKKIFPLLLAGEVFFRYVSVQSVNVTDGSLPPDAFLAELAEHAPQKRGKGEDIAHPDAAAEPELWPSAKSNRMPQRRLSRRALLIVTTGILAIALAITALLMLPTNQPESPPSELTDTASPRTPGPIRENDAGASWEGDAGLIEEVPQEAGECQFEWFFGNESAVAGDCPFSGWIELDGLVQHFGDGVLIGVKLEETYDNARYFALMDTGVYYDLVGDWDTSLNSMGACVLLTVNGFLSALPYDDSPDEVTGCPLQPVQFRTLSYQTSMARGAFVFYIGTRDGDLFRLSAPSSQLGTEGTWQRIH